MLVHESGEGSAVTHTITLIPGDGIGPEVSEATCRVLEATGVELRWQIEKAGVEALQASGTPLPDSVVESIRGNRVALKAPVTTPIGGGFRSVNVELRQKLDLYINFRPARSLPGVPSRNENVDLLVIRENSEGLYSGLEHEVVPGVVESLRVVTESGSRRIVEAAFKIAGSLGRRKVTVVHKANILKLSDGLFLNVARQVADSYPDIEYEEAIIDATAMRLVQNPGQFDVLVMENLFGDIISDLTAGLVGGLGVAPSANLGAECAVFEAVHGSAPDIAGKGVANPTALLLSGALMLRHLGEKRAAESVERSVRHVLAEGAHLTPDLGGKATTREYADALIDSLE